MMLDQFFTNEDIAERCIKTIDQESYDVIVEPSAGSGSFFNLLTQDNIGIDLDPKIPGLLKQDYLTWVPEFNSSKRILVIGNPPFGKNSSIAVKFFNHSSYADTIAFIVPRTFRKPSLINRLNDNFKLKKEIHLPRNSFHLPDGTPYDVPCVWQVWNKGSIDYKRAKISTEKTHEDFQFVDKNTASFLVQRVGVNAGAVHKDFNRSSNSHYCIKANDSVYNTMKDIVWNYKSPKYNTVGNPSISKNDLIKAYEKTKLRKKETTPIISKQSIIKQLEENGVIKVDYKVKEYIDEALENWWPGVFSITNYDDLTVFHYTDLIEDVITKYNRGV